MQEISINGTTLAFVERPRVKHRLQRDQLYNRLLNLQGVYGSDAPTHVPVKNHIWNFAYIMAYATASDPVDWYASPGSTDDQLLAALDAFGEWYDEDLRLLEAFMANIGNTQPEVDPTEIDELAESIALALLGIEVVGDEDVMPEDDDPFTYPAATLMQCWLDYHQRNIYPEKGGYLEQDAELLRQMQRFGAKVFKFKDEYQDDKRIGMEVDVNQYTQDGTAAKDLFS